MAIQYYMRGYNTTAPGPVGYVDWVVNDNPDSSATYVPAPYSSVNITHITVNRIVQSKVANFIKPNEGLSSPSISNDGNWIHVNAYDWIHTTPPGPPIPLPVNPTGLAVVRGSNDGVTPRDYSTMFWSESSSRWEFALNTNGDGTTIGSLQDVAVHNFFIGGYLALGTNPASTGIIRLPNAQSINARNALNTGDITLIEGDINNNVQVGSISDPVYIPGPFLRVDNYISQNNPIGAVAQQGFIRAQNNVPIVAARDLLNTQDFIILSTDTSNFIHYGSPNSAGQIFDTGTGNRHQFNTNSIPNLYIGNTYLSFDALNATPLINQITTASGNGYNLTVAAQTSSAIGSFGGALLLESGSGVAGNGYVDLTTVSAVNPMLRAYPTNSGTSFNGQLISFNPTIAFDTSVASPIIRQNSIGASAISAATLTVAAQQNTAASVGSLGGNLALSSGSSAAGTTSAGHVLLQTGGVTWVDVDPTSSPYATVYINGNLTVLGTTTTVDSTTVDVVGRVIHGNFSTGIHPAPAAPNLPNSMTGYAVHRGSATGIAGQDRDSAALIYNETTDIYADGYWKLVGVLHDSDVAPSTTGLINTLPLLTSAVVATNNPVQEYSAKSAIPTVGGFRSLNNTTAVSSRNAAGTQDLRLIGTDSTDHIVLGTITTPINNGFIFYTTTGSLYDFFVNNTSQVQLSSDGNGPFVRESATSYNVASTGFVRARNNITLVAARNAANTQDLLVLGTDSSNRILHGAASAPQNAGQIFNTSTGSIYDFQINSVSQVQISANNITFTNTDTSPTVSQGSVTTASATGQALTIQAQNATGTTSTGGAAVITSGTGTTVSGNVQLQTGAVDRVIVHPTFTEFRDSAEAYRITPVSVGATTLQAASTATSVIYKQADLTTASGTGAATTIQAQNETGTTSTGGALNLTSGTGTATNGSVNLQAGGITTASVVTNKFVFNAGSRRNVTRVTGTYAVLASDDYIAVTTLTSAFTITLPASPTIGDSYQIKDTTGNALAFNVTIAGNGNTIDGLTNFVLAQPYAAATFTYTGVQWSVT
jgi:hypothetical protein